MGYGEAQMKDLEATINGSDVDLVIVGTPIDLTRVIKIKKPYQRVRYELQELGTPTLEDLLKEKFGKNKYRGGNRPHADTIRMAMSHAYCAN